MDYTLRCLLCDKTDQEVGLARTGDPSNKLVAMQEHCMDWHSAEIGLPFTDVGAAMQHAKRHAIGNERYEWSINGVLWLRAEPHPEDERQESP